VPDTYGNDLAYIHDAGFGQFARSAAPVLVDALKSGGIEHGLVVDLGCGSGILSQVVSDAGYEVLGIDISEAMIELARGRVLHGQFRTESLLTAHIPPCVAVTAVGECLNYRFDERHSPSKLTALFRRIHQALLPGGLFLGDVAVPGRVPGQGPHKSFWEGQDWVVLVTAQENRNRKQLTREITSFRRVGDLYRRDHEIHHQRLLSRLELAQKLRKAGFRLRSLSGYGSLRFGRGHTGFLARKRV